MSKARKEFKVFHSEIKIKVGGKEVILEIVHDLPETFGMSIQNAVDNWLIRTDDYTAQSLCDYIKAKSPERLAVTKAHFDMIKEIEEQ